MEPATKRSIALFCICGGITILWMAGIIWYVQSARKSAIPYEEFRHYRRIYGGYNPFAKDYIPERYRGNTEHPWRNNYPGNPNMILVPPWSQVHPTPYNGPGVVIVAPSGK